MAQRPSQTLLQQPYHEAVTQDDADQDQELTRGLNSLSIHEKKYRQERRTFNPPHDPLQPSKYQFVEVLLVQWASDDLEVRLELPKLKKVFEWNFNFNVTSFLIPDNGPEDALIQELQRFRKQARGPEYLLIFYYAGHGGGDSDQFFFVANRKPNSPFLDFNNVQGLLLGHEVDVQVILDCSQATLAAHSRSVFSNWFLGASSKESPAAGVSADSFTRALIRALESGAQRYWADGTRLTIQSIHHSLITRERYLEFTPSLVRLNEHDSELVELTPLLVKQFRPRPIPKAQTEDFFTSPNNALVAAQVQPPLHPRPPARDNAEPSHAAEPNGPSAAASEEDVYAGLAQYDTVFLVDDSGSMAGTFWNWTAQAISAITRIAVRYDSDGVDVRFLNSDHGRTDGKDLTTHDEVMALFAKVKPGGKTPTARALDKELNSYLGKLEKNADIKGLNLIVITDGEPTESHDVEPPPGKEGDPTPQEEVGGVIAEYAEALKKLRAWKFQVGIQFVQIGGAADATEFLRWLDDDLKKTYKLDRDMVDTVKWEEGHQEILHQKILLGGILKRFDRKAG